MTAFLFLKQISDLLYQFHFLDYAMVVMAVVALFYQVLLVRPVVRKHVQLADVAILMLVGLVTFRFVRSPQGAYSTYVKVLSAFLMYFVGRMYYERVQECSGALVASGYVIVYANLLHRIIVFGSEFFHVVNAEGDLYYNDTDLAFGLLLAFIFIIMYGRNSLFKVLTIFFTIPVLLFCSDAGVQKILYIAIFVLVIIYCLERLGVPRKTANGILIVGIVGLAVMILMLLLPVFTGKFNPVSKLFGDGWVTYAQLETRYEEWKSAWFTIYDAPVLQKICGVSLGVVQGNQYIAALFATGFLGCFAAILFGLDLLRRVFLIEDRKTYYVMVLLAILFMGSSILKNCMEFTQCSWFFMMYGGMVISGCKKNESI